MEKDLFEIKIGDLYMRIPKNLESIKEAIDILKTKKAMLRLKNFKKNRSDKKAYATRRS